MPFETWEACFAVAVVCVLIVGLARNWAPSDLLVLAALTVMVLVGELSGSTLLPPPGAAVSGFGSKGLLTVGALFVVVAGLTHTGAMTLVTQPLMKRPDTLKRAQLQLLPPVAALSAFLNNTPVVAMFLPVVTDLCKKFRFSPSHLFLPLSYAATFGGLCTLIGTSTNLLINNEVARRDIQGFEPLGMFELSWIGLPLALSGLAYLLFATKWLLPDRKPAISLTDDPRQYTVEMLVDPDGPLAGQSVEEAGLRHLPGLFLAEIDRYGVIIPAVSPHERLQENDHLVFVGILESVVDLKKIRGLVPPDQQHEKVDVPDLQRCLIEAVVSNRCPLIGKSIREGRFRTQYNAAVLAIARSGEKINAKLGDVVLRAGDTLLLESHTGFERQQRNSPDFFLVSSVDDSTPVRHGHARIALGIMTAMVLGMTFGPLDTMTNVMIAAGLMIGTRCCSGTEARRSVDVSLLTVIGGALGLGMSLEMSGAASSIADGLVGLAGSNVRVNLLALYFVTALFTELITNNAAALIVFPIAMSTAQRLGVDPRPFVVTVMVAASAAFATPHGYQTNLMVYGPGGYRFSDYLRFGIPLSLLFMTLTVLLVPLIW